MDYLINFLNDKPITVGGVIITSVLSSIITLVLVFLFKSVIFRMAKSLYVKCESNLRKKYRMYTGKLTFKEMCELEKKKELGTQLTVKEEKILEDCHKKLAEAISKLNIKDIQMPKLPKI